MTVRRAIGHQRRSTGQSGGGRRQRKSACQGRHSFSPRTPSAASVKGVRGEKECPGEGRRGRTAGGGGGPPRGVAKERQLFGETIGGTRPATSGTWRTAPSSPTTTTPRAQ